MRKTYILRYEAEGDPAEAAAGEAEDANSVALLEERFCELKKPRRRLGIVPFFFTSTTPSPNQGGTERM